MFASIGGDSSKLVVDLGQIANTLNVMGFTSKGQHEQSAATLPQCKVAWGGVSVCVVQGEFQSVRPVRERIGTAQAGGFCG